MKHYLSCVLSAGSSAGVAKSWKWEHVADLLPHSPGLVALGVQCSEIYLLLVQIPEVLGLHWCCHHGPVL